MFAKGRKVFDRFDRIFDRHDRFRPPRCYESFCYVSNGAVVCKRLDHADAFSQKSPLIGSNGRGKITSSTEQTTGVDVPNNSKIAVLARPESQGSVAEVPGWLHSERALCGAWPHLELHPAQGHTLAAGVLVAAAALPASAAGIGVGAGASVGGSSVVRLAQTSVLVGIAVFRPAWEQPLAEHAA